MRTVQTVTGLSGATLSRNDSDFDPSIAEIATFVVESFSRLSLVYFRRFDDFQPFPDAKPIVEDRIIFHWKAAAAAQRSPQLR